jgi:catechol 2,3-dioxygenase-like lactoylglutathione lyase family enzyme
MPRAQIRHLAIFARDPAKLAKFYHEVFGMDIIHESPTGGVFVSDGHLTLALLQHRLAGAGSVGLNHFGFSLDNVPAVVDNIVEHGLERPQRRGMDVPYAELRAVDPEGNWFDLSQHGFEKVMYDDQRPEALRSTAKANARA